MDSPEEKVMKEFGVLKDKLGKLKPAEGKSVFTRQAARDFTMGFYDVIIGSLAFLEDNTTTHLKIQCVTSCNQLGNATITEHESYEAFARDILQLTPPVFIEFKFLLTENVYPVGNVDETFTVYFQRDQYEIVYHDITNTENRLIKTYLTYMTPHEVLHLRDSLSLRIIKTVSDRIDGGNGVAR